MMDMNESIIIGPANKINWLMVAAFRYAVNRHTTQAMYEAHCTCDCYGIGCTEIKAGDRIAQMIPRKMEDVDLVEVEELSETERGTGGFGSTGTR